MGASLYNLTADYEHVLNMLYDDEYDEQTVIDTLDSIEGAIEEKADGYAMIIRMVDADIESIKAEEARLANRRIALENKKKRMKGNLYETMKTVGKPKFKTSLFSFGIRKNGGRRALILDVDVDKLPAELQKLTIEANNEALREYLGKNESCEYCHLAEQGEYLTIS